MAVLLAGARVPEALRGSLATAARCFASSSASSAGGRTSWFSHVEMAPRDPILGVTEAYNADPKKNKINLGVVSFAGRAAVGAAGGGAAGGVGSLLIAPSQPPANPCESLRVRARRRHARTHTAHTARAHPHTLPHTNKKRARIATTPASPSCCAPCARPSAASAASASWNTSESAACR